MVEKKKVLNFIKFTGSVKELIQKNVIDRYTLPLNNEGINKLNGIISLRLIHSGIPTALTGYHQETLDSIYTAILKDFPQLFVTAEGEDGNSVDHGYVSD